MIPLVLAAALRAFAAGNDLYLRGNYQGAIAAYDTARKEAPASAEICYNLGNAYYRLEDKAHAILYYEKALVLAPRGDDARANLKKAREGLTLTAEEKVTAAASFPSSPLAGWLTMDEAALLFLSVYIPWTLLLFLLLTTKMTKGTGRRLFARLFLVFSIPTLILGVLLLGYWASAQQKYGILLGSQVELKEGPENSALSDAAPSGGLKVRILESARGTGETWYKVELPGGRIGWVQDAFLGLI